MTVKNVMFACVFLVFLPGCTQSRTSVAPVEFFRDTCHVTLLAEGAAVVRLGDLPSSRIFVFPLSAANVAEIHLIVSAVSTSVNSEWRRESGEVCFVTTANGQRRAFVRTQDTWRTDEVCRAMSDLIENVAFIKLAGAVNESLDAQQMIAQGDIVEGAKKLDSAARDVWNWGHDRYYQYGTPVWEPSESYSLRYPNTGNNGTFLWTNRFEDRVENLPNISPEGMVEIAHGKWEFAAGLNFNVTKKGTTCLINFDDQIAPFWGIKVLKIQAPAIEQVESFAKLSRP
jgi:hypothetical protein